MILSHMSVILIYLISSCAPMQPNTGNGQGFTAALSPSADTSSLDSLESTFGDCDKSQSDILSKIIEIDARAIVQGAADAAIAEDKLSSSKFRQYFLTTYLPHRNYVRAWLLEVVYGIYHSKTLKFQCHFESHQCPPNLLAITDSKKTGIILVRPSFLIEIPP